MNIKKTSLKEKSDFIIDYLYNQFSISKNEIFYKFKNDNIPSINIKFDNQNIRFDFHVEQYNQISLEKNIFIFRPMSKE